MTDDFTMAYSNNLVMYSSLAKRDGSNVSPQSRVIPAEVYDVTHDVYKPDHILPPSPRVPYIEYLMTFILCSIGALGAFSYAMDIMNDVLTEGQQVSRNYDLPDRHQERQDERRGRD